MLRLLNELGGSIAVDATVDECTLTLTAASSSSSAADSAASLGPATGPDGEASSQASLRAALPMTLTLAACRVEERHDAEFCWALETHEGGTRRTIILAVETQKGLLSWIQKLRRAMPLRFLDETMDRCVACVYVQMYSDTALAPWLSEDVCLLQRWRHTASYLLTTHQPLNGFLFSARMKEFYCSLCFMTEYSTNVMIFI